MCGRCGIAFSATSRGVSAVVDVVDLVARCHHLARAPVAEHERSLGQALLVALDQPALAALPEQQAQLVLAVRRVPGLRRRRDPEGLQDEVAEAVEEIDERLGDEVEAAHQRGERERDRHRAGDRGALGRKLAEHHVQHRDDQERKRRREAEAGEPRVVPEQRLEQLVERPLADRAEAERGDRDPELAGGQVRVDVLDGVLRRARSRAPLAHEVGQLRRAQPRDRELGRDEKRVREHECEREHQVGGHDPTVTRDAAITRRAARPAAPTPAASRAASADTTATATSATGSASTTIHQCGSVATPGSSDASVIPTTVVNIHAPSGSPANTAGSASTTPPATTVPVTCRRVAPTAPRIATSRRRSRTPRSSVVSRFTPAIASSSAVTP